MHKISSQRMKSSSMQYLMVALKYESKNFSIGCLILRELFLKTSRLEYKGRQIHTKLDGCRECTVSKEWVFS